MPEEQNSPDLLLTGAGSITIGAIAQNLQVNMPESWRSDGSFWDIWSHIGNVPATFICTSVTILTVAHIRDQLLSKVPISQAIRTTAIGFVMGCAANVVVETPDIANTPIVSDIFSDRQADSNDLWYGIVTSVLGSSLLGWAASERKSKVS